jgi:PKD repeat protein
MPQPVYFNPNMTIVPTSTPTSASVPATVQFTVSGDPRTLSLGAVNISWNFGDGSTGGGVSPSHTYTTEDFFTVQMTASSIQNPSNVTMAQTFVSISAPTIVASFVPQGTTVVYTAPYYSASAADSITMLNTSTAGVPLTYVWSLPGATPSTSTATNPVVVYGTPGVFTATLTVSDGYGDSVVGTRKIQITPALLVASIASPPDMDTGASPLVESFVNGTLPVPAISNPVTWKWTFNSGSIPNQATINSTPVTFDNPGTFVVKLEATGSDGQKSDTSISVVAT